MGDERRGMPHANMLQLWTLNSSSSRRVDFISVSASQEEKIKKRKAGAHTFGGRNFSFIRSHTMTHCERENKGVLLLRDASASRILSVCDPAAGRSIIWRGPSYFRQSSACKNKTAVRLISKGHCTSNFWYSFDMRPASRCRKYNAPACPMFSNKMPLYVVSRWCECVRTFMGADFYTFSQCPSVRTH